MGVREQQSGVRAQIRARQVRIARRNFISRTARVLAKLGRSLFQELQTITQAWINGIMNDSESVYGGFMSEEDHPIPDKFGKTVERAMIHVFAQGYWLEYIFEQDRSVAGGFKGKITLSDKNNMSEEEKLREALESLIKFSGPEDEWKKIIPEDAINWLKSYTPSLKDVLERDVLDKVNKVIQDSCLRKNAQGTHESA